MVETTPTVNKRRQLVVGVATGFAVALLIAVAHAATPIAVGAVVLASAASSGASTTPVIAAGNFVVGVGVFGTIAILLANDGVPSGDGRALLFATAAIPLLALALSAGLAARKVTREPALEFEAQLLVGAAAAAFAAVLITAAVLTVVDVVSAVPNPPPVVYLVVCVSSFVLALNVERRRMG